MEKHAQFFSSCWGLLRNSTGFKIVYPQTVFKDGCSHQLGSDWAFELHLPFLKLVIRSKGWIWLEKLRDAQTGDLLNTSRLIRALNGPWFTKWSRFCAQYNLKQAAGKCILKPKCCLPYSSILRLFFLRPEGSLPPTGQQKEYRFNAALLYVQNQTWFIHILLPVVKPLSSIPVSILSK